MGNIFKDNETEAVSLVDASNALTLLNHLVALHKVQVLCPQFSPILINTYREISRMVFLEKNEIMSREDATQGDNLEMSFYAIGITPLLRSLKIKFPDIKQISLDDDVACIVKVKILRSGGLS